ncbi:MAG: hypothetical protein GF334_03615 [Candidatus Altiarchaeales archaeon]|nr:hypothetical protein [Candidatus Altiarchaeales archaeon]
MEESRLKELSLKGDLKATEELLRHLLRTGDREALLDFQEEVLAKFSMWANMVVSSSQSWGYPRRSSEELRALCEFGAVQNKPNHKWHLVRPRWGTTLCGRSLLLEKVPPVVATLYYSSLIHWNEYYAQDSRMTLPVRTWRPEVDGTDLCARCRNSSYGRSHPVTERLLVFHSRMREIPPHESVDLWWKTFIPVFYARANG